MTLFTSDTRAAISEIKLQNKINSLILSDCFLKHYGENVLEKYYQNLVSNFVNKFKYAKRILDFNSVGKYQFHHPHDKTSFAMNKLSRKYANFQINFHVKKDVCV